MIKIAYIIDTIFNPSAGTEGQLLMLLKNLDRDKFEPHLICLQNSDWIKTQTFDFPFTVIDFQKLLSLDTPRFISKFKKIHQKEHFDIVQVFFIDANIIGVMAAKQAGVKAILASRRNAGDRHNTVQMQALRFLKRYTTKYLANSEEIARITMEVEGTKPEQMEVIYNGMDLARFDNITEEMRLKQRRAWNIGKTDILVGLVANLRPVKNIESLIEAAAVINGRYENVRFVVIGEGNQREILQAKINDMGLTQRFRLAGRHDDIIPCLAAFDIGVLCSKAEGFSNSILEYMGAGLPVVASNVGGNKEAINHEVTGLIYDLKSLDDFVDSLTKLIKSDDLRRLMGKLGREKAQSNYDISKCIENHQRFYKEILELKR